MAKRILLVGNPTAQSGRAAARIEAALGKLAARGHAVQFQPTPPRREEHPSFFFFNQLPFSHIYTISYDESLPI